MFSFLVASITSTTLLTTPIASPSVSLARTVESASRYVAAQDGAAQAIERARAAQALGDLIGAQKEYTRAIRIQRADGILSVDASYGAAHVLNLQGQHRDAADVLDQLAADANLLGDADLEARVLLDVVALKTSHHRKAAARPDALRLKELVTDVRLTSDTRRLIKARLS